MPHQIEIEEVFLLIESLVDVAALERAALTLVASQHIAQNIFRNIRIYWTDFAIKGIAQSMI